MKILRWLAFVSTAAVICLTLGHPASATAVGSLNEANCAGGGVTITATTITWSPTGTVAGTGCIDTGIGTSLTYSGGVLGTGVAGNIKNLVAGGGAVDQFMTFQGTTLDFVLTSLGPGVGSTLCTGLAIGGTCSPFAGSPFIFTNLGGGSTAIGLSAHGSITDGGVLSNWGGIFTLQLNQTPDAIQTTLVGGGNVGSTQSAQFTVTASATTPEPGSMLLLGTGVASIFGMIRRKRSS